MRLCQQILADVKSGADWTAPDRHGRTDTARIASCRIYAWSRQQRPTEMSVVFSDSAFARAGTASHPAETSIDAIVARRSRGRWPPTCNRALAGSKSAILSNAERGPQVAPNQVQRLKEPRREQAQSQPGRPPVAPASNQPTARQGSGKPAGSVAWRPSRSHDQTGPG